MKYIISFLITVVLLSSCDVTKRRYTSGYSVNWGRKAPKKITAKEPVIARNTIVPQLKPIPTKGISILTTPTKKWTVPAHLKPVNTLQSKNISSNHIAANPKVPIPVVSGPPKVDKGDPQFFTGDEQEDDHAKKSLVFGVLSLASPAATFLIMLGIVLSVGGTLAKPATYALAIFLLGCAGGLAFAIVAIISGFIALQEINAAPDTYVGTGDAILGMILAALIPIGIAAYLMVRFGLKK